MDDLKILLEFSGGAELLFGNEKQKEVRLPNDRSWTIKDLLVWIKVGPYISIDTQRKCIMDSDYLI